MSTLFDMLSCDRDGCDNILENKHEVEGMFFLCHQCYIELKNSNLDENNYDDVKKFITNKDG